MEKPTLTTQKTELDKRNLARLRGSVDDIRGYTTFLYILFFVFAGLFFIGMLIKFSDASYYEHPSAFPELIMIAIASILAFLLLRVSQSAKEYSKTGIAKKLFEFNNRLKLFFVSLIVISIIVVLILVVTGISKYY